MSEKPYQPTARKDWGDNINIGGSLNGDAVHQVGQWWTELGEKLAASASRFHSGLNTGQHEWRGTGFDGFHDEGERVKNTVSHNQETFGKYGGDIKNHGTETAQAKSVIGSNSACEWGKDDGPAAEACANALQTVYRPPGEDAFKEIDYVPSPQSPDGGGLGGNGSSSSGGGGGPSSSGGSPSNSANGGGDRYPGVNPGGDGEHTPASFNNGADKGASDDGKGAGGSPGGGAGDGAGGGSPSGGGGPPGGGPPPGGPPPGGTGTAGSATPAGYDLGDSTGGLPDGVDAAGAGGGFAGGVGGLGGGGDRERALGSKPGGAGGMKPEFKVNVPKPPSMPAGIGGGMGGGMAPGAQGGKKDDKEHKTASYLYSTDHGYEVIGGALPTANPEVIGDLTRAEVREMDEKAQEQAEQPKGQTGSTPPPPLPPSGPVTRHQAGGA